MTVTGQDIRHALRSLDLSGQAVQHASGAMTQWRAAQSFRAGKVPRDVLETHAI